MRQDAEAQKAALEKILRGKGERSRREERDAERKEEQKAQRMQRTAHPKPGFTDTVSP